MLKEIFQWLLNVLGSNTVPAKPAAVTNLKREAANVKVAWEPSTAPDILSQHIVVIAHTLKIIDKQLSPETHTFSFQVAKKSMVTITITAINGAGEGEPATLELFA